jgi:hypothetical protein
VLEFFEQLTKVPHERKKPATDMNAGGQ